MSTPVNTSKIRALIAESANLKNAMMADDDLLHVTMAATKDIIDSINRNGKIFFCGNGGSAADAQHLAAEFVGKFGNEKRRALRAEALSTNSSIITALGNDFGFDHIFSRQIEGDGDAGDVLIALSTSGHSKNIIAAIATAAEKGITTIGLTGKNGGGMKDLCDHLIRIPSNETSRIQECHILIGHIICELVEKAIFPDSPHLEKQNVV